MQPVKIKNYLYSLPCKIGAALADVIVISQAPIAFQSFVHSVHNTINGKHMHFIVVIMIMIICKIQTALGVTIRLKMTGKSMTMSEKLSKNVIVYLLMGPL